MKHLLVVVGLFCLNVSPLWVLGVCCLLLIAAFAVVILVLSGMIVMFVGRCWYWVCAVASLSTFICWAGCAFTGLLSGVLNEAFSLLIELVCAVLVISALVQAFDSAHALWAVLGKCWVPVTEFVNNLSTVLFNGNLDSCSIGLVLIYSHSPELLSSRLTINKNGETCLSM